MKHITLQLIDPAQLVHLLGDDGYKALCQSTHPDHPHDLPLEHWTGARIHEALALPVTVFIRDFSVAKGGHLWLLLETSE